MLTLAFCRKFLSNENMGMDVLGSLNFLTKELLEAKVTHWVRGFESCSCIRAPSPVCACVRKRASCRRKLRGVGPAGGPWHREKTLMAEGCLWAKLGTHLEVSLKMRIQMCLLFSDTCPDTWMVGTKTRTSRDRHSRVWPQGPVPHLPCEVAKFQFPHLWNGIRPPYRVVERMRNQGVQHSAWCPEPSGCSVTVSSNASFFSFLF